MHPTDFPHTRWKRLGTVRNNHKRNALMRR
jgi:hypothetical protein